MISSDDQIQLPDPSSHDFKINYVQKVHSSDSDIDLYFKSWVADLDDINNTHPNFSIRDYAFNSRNKDIACNWPFSHKTLKICLKHGVKNLLPPFQSLESLRNNSSNEEIVSISDGKLNPELTLESKTSKKSQTHLQVDLGQTKSKKLVLVSSRKLQKAIKKCRIQPTEEVIPMASQVCPVCKTFSSSSNTTLNAHIDQCLSGESSMKWTANPKEMVKSRIIKRRKMRLMVEIYKTAPRCTVEELDARNGTSWANSSSFPAQEFEFQGEEATNVVREVADHEGDVYIDINGTKVRILSMPKVDKISDDHQAEKKQGKSSKFFMVKKKNKNHEDKHHHKYLKLSTNNKKLCSQKPHHRAFSEVTIGERSNKEDGSKEMVNKDDFPIVRPPWACSKRTALVKKLRASITPLRSCNKMATFSQQNSQKIENLTKFSKLGQYAKKRSQLLAKSSSKHLKKKGTLLHEDQLDTCPFKRSMSKGSKFSSLEKKLSPVSRGKRKISAFRRSCVHPLSKETVVGSLQDSLQQKRRVEEYTSEKLSCESMNLLEVRNNEETEIFCSQENSIVSRSLRADSSCDVESIRKETRLHKEQVSTMPIPKGIDVASLNLDNKETVSEKLQGISSMAVMSTVDLSEEHHYHDITDRDFMSDSPLSTVSNPSIGRSDSDKFSARSTSLKDETYTPITSSDWTSMQTSAFKNDDNNSSQPCFCSRKETAFFQASTSSYQESSTLRKHAIESFNFRPHMYSIGNETLSNLSNSPPPPLPPHRDCDSVGGPVLRLMGKNLTVVKTDDQDVPQMSSMGPFLNVLPEYKLPSFGYHFQNQNRFRSQLPTSHLDNNMGNHACGTMLHSTFDDRMVMHNDPSIELHHHS